ncbi:ankyrin repeat domain-containing protein 46-like [Maylandia zebra]|uniref:ankyrin repeat domain-containing protein 46-like n=1 Tax=Maylandia zebra TaxID=106582 RepID=UPI00403C7F8C
MLNIRLLTAEHQTLSVILPTVSLLTPATMMDALMLVERREVSQDSPSERAEGAGQWESCSLLNPTLQSTEGVLSSIRTNWQEFVEDDGFWRVLLLMVVITLLSLGLAYYVSRVLPFSGWRGGRKINEDLYVE